MKCPACGAGNEDAAEVCFECRQVIRAVTRGTVLLDRYEILDTLGRGGMGVVYKAKDRVLDEIVAVKTLHADIANDQELSWRFRTEIKLARKVSHRNVCRIYEYGEHDGLRFISMEYIAGTDLKRMIRDRGPLPANQAFDYAIQAARGVAAIHEVGIIHRDLKTLNIMIDGSGVVRLMDFGIAKSQDRDATSGTGTGQILGTPEYMSPEQARALPIDARADVYALGIVVYEMFTGQVPFRGLTPVATLFMHVQDPPPLEGGAASRLPQALVPVLRRALAKEPQERYATAAEMAEALEAARTTTLGGAAPALAAGEEPTAWIGTAAKASAGKESQGSAVAALVVLAAVMLALFRGPAVLDLFRPEAAVPAPVASPTHDVPPADLTEPSAPPSGSSGVAPAIALPSAAPPPDEDLAATLGVVHLTVTPAAEVTIDGVPLGTIESRDLTLSVGVHQVVVSHPDFEPLRRDLDVVAHRAATVQLDLRRDAVPREPAPR